MPPTLLPPQRKGPLAAPAGTVLNSRLPAVDSLAGNFTLGWLRRRCGQNHATKTINAGHCPKGLLKRQQRHAFVLLLPR
ncbi:MULTISPECIES: hypothetical protein [unclassified Desulfovibrio]|uniref:hypothetical protein n=1 Tax=unclassified Desulfovibrio TaxID=2593640 RepID=UPI002FDB90AE